ncbi:MAG: glycosyltransferase family 39 protein [bacterium]
MKEKYFTITVFLSIVSFVFIVYYPALHFGMAGLDLNLFVKAGNGNLSEVWAYFTGFLHSVEFRPLNHYLFFLASRKLFGYNSQALHAVVLLINCCNAFLLYLLVSRITGSRKTALLSLLVFLTRIAVIRSYYILNYSPPKLCFFTLLTFILYLKSKERKAVFSPLYVFTYLLAMLTRETFVLLPVGILFYELVFNRGKKITLAEVKKRLAGLYPFFAVIFGYLLIRVPFFIGKVSMKKQGVSISFRSLSVNHFFGNLMNLIRFNFNFLTRSIASVRLSNMGLNLVDVNIYIAVLVSGHIIYSQVLRRPMRLSGRLRNNMIWGSAWFLLYVSLYCFFSTLSPEYLYLSLVGSSLAVASWIEYYYDLFYSEKALLFRGISFLLAVHFLAGFYFLVRTRTKDDGLLKWWPVADKYMADIRKSRPEISPGGRVHYYIRGNVSRHVLGNEHQLNQKGEGYLFKYIYENDKLEVIGHDYPVDPAGVRTGDLVFRLEPSRLIDETSGYR